MNKIYTTIEQSRRLIELGIDVNTADMWWAERYKGRTTMDFQYIVDEEPYYYLSFIKPSNDNYSQDTIKDIPAWSLSALLSLMPFQYIENNNRFGFYQVKGFNKQGETYRFGYKTNNDSFLFETSWYNDVIDAAFEIVIWLKENGKI